MEYRFTQIDEHLLRTFLLGRAEDSHKGDFGHALLVCGCERMPGAAVLATGAALKSGCGLVSLCSTRTACTAAISSFPSAMLVPSSEDVIASMPCDFARYNAVGVGPGLGKDARTVAALRQLLERAAGEGANLVLDADALNVISENRDLFDLIPQQSVLTPHLGELKRLLAKENPSEQDIIALCERTRSAIVVKGPHTHVYVHTGDVYVNTTGNAGLAKGGSGDVLTGLLTGLLARGYRWYEAAILAVWLHGFAADRLSASRTPECWNSRDLIDCLYTGFVALA